MRVCFSVGEKSNEIVQKIKTTLDNVDFYSYMSIQDLIKESNLRRLYFDRIILSEKILKDTKKDLRDLNNYISTYSNNTSIVLLCRKDNLENEKVFTELFNSPLYTPALLDKLSVIMLNSLITEDISSIRSKYYSLDVKEAQTLTVKYQNSKIKENLDPGVEPSLEKVKKKGFLSRLFGKSDSVANMTKQVISTPVVGNVVPDIPNTVSNNTLDNASSLGSKGSVNGGSTMLSSDDNENGSDGISQSSRVGGVSLGTENNRSGNLNEDISGMFLGLENIGDIHPDTGFLDESELESLSSSMDNKLNNDSGVQEMSDKEKELNKNQDTPNYVDSEDFENSSSTGSLEENIADVDLGLIRSELEIPYKEDVIVFPDTNKIRVLIGGVDSNLVYSIARGYKNQGLRTVIIALNNENLDILKRFGTLKVLNNSEDTKIGSLQKYVTGDIDLLYSTFRGTVIKSDIESLDVIHFFDDYECVLIDCPYSKIGSLSDTILKKASVIINGGTEVADLITLLNNITGTLDSTSIEDLLYNIASVNFTGSKEDLRYLENECLFSRENWLLKI